MRTLNVTIAIGALVALIGAGLVFAYGQNVDDRIADGRQTVSVLVATEDLDPGMSAVEVEGSTELRDIPSAYVPEDAIDSLDNLQGLVLAGAVAQDSQLTAAHFIDPDLIASVEPSPGHVALAVQVDLSPGVARFIQRGSTVDVFATYENVSGAQQQSQPGQPPGGLNRESLAQNRTKLFLSGVRVLSVRVAPVQRLDSETSDEDQTPVDEVIAVLDVLPKDAERIVNVASLGRLYLALSIDGTVNTTKRGVTPGDVVRSNRR